MNSLVAALVIALAAVETPHGVPALPGPAGETGRWQLTPAVRRDRGADLRARGEAVTDEAVAAEQVRWLMRELKAAGVDPLPFNVALAWNCGLSRTLSGKAPERSFDFAGRVTHLVQVSMQTTTISSGALTPFATVAREADLEPWALQKLEQARFRCEENYREVDGVPHLTVAGIRAMARALDQHGYAIRSHSLRVLANRVEQTPSARLVAPCPKSSEAFPWQQRADLA